MKYINKLILAIAFSLVSISSLFAQNQIIIQSVLIPPYPVYYSDITTMPGLATVIVQNTDMNNSYTLRFRMKLDGGNGISLLLTEDVIPSNPISIGPGEVKTLTGDDFASIYHGIGLEDLVVTGISEKSVLQSQRIPDGLYKLCVQAFSNDNVKPLSGYEPTGCSNKMQIITIEPPVILSPLDEAEITATDPQQILMRWTTVNSATAAMLYDIRIAEVPEGVSAYEAMRSDNLLFFEELDYPATVFSYGPSFPSLVSGKNYALQIKAHDATDNANIRNGGKSDVVKFRYKHANKMKPPTFNCNGPCLTPPRPTSKTPLANLVTGDNVRIGHFNMTILQANKVGIKYSGEAILSTSSFFTIPILLEFNDIIINNNYEVTSGLVTAKQKNELSSISCYQDAAGFVPQSNQDMAQIYDAVINQNSTVTTYMNNPSSASVYSGVNLPVGYGNSGKEMVIIGMYFRSTGATMNLVSGYQMAGDANTGVINLVYGTNNICISPGGPTSGAGTNDIVLLNAVDFHPNANMTVRFEPGNIGANTGCWARFNCSGIVEFYIRGAIEMDRGSFLPEDAAGNLIPNKSLGANFQVTTINPYNWVAPLTFSGTTTLLSVEITPHLRVIALPDYSFDIRKMYYDNSLTTNPPGIRFSANERDQLGSVKTWKGVFIPELDLLMPNYFNENDSGRIAVSVNNFHFDDNGYSFYSRGSNLLTRDRPGKFEDWDFTILRHSVRVVHSELNYCNLIGEIKLDFADSYIRYRGLMNASNSGSRYFLNIYPGQSFNVDMWKARISLDSNSVIKGSSIGGNINAEANISGKLSLNESIEGIDWIAITGIKFENLKAYSHQPYFQGGHFDLVGDNGHKFGGFDISIEDIGFESLNPDEGNIAKMALDFDFRFDFSDNTNEFSADANVKIIGKKETDDSNWAFDSVLVGRINIQGEAPLVEIDGTLDWYQNHPTYHNGYRGDVVAYFFNDRSFMVESEALFGSKNAYKYWYVDGATVWGSDNLLSMLLLKGFGGGAFNNMKANGSYSPMRLGVRNENPSYSPFKNGKGFKAMVVVASPINENIFNGVTQVEVGFLNGNVETFGFNGDYGLLRSLPMGPNADYSKPMISAKGTIDLHGSTNSKNRYLDANLRYEMNIPRNPSILWGTGSLSYHTGHNGWYLRIGYPSPSGDVIDDMINTNIGIRYKMFGNTYSLSASAHSYFDFGSILPPLPRYPNYVPQHLRNLNLQRPSPAIAGSGAMMGVHKSFGMPKKESFTVLGCGVNFRADAGFGFDLALSYKEGALCDGSADFGINNWRADGQGYMYAIADLDGEILYKDFSIAEVMLGADMKAILPEPLYLGAGLTGTIGLPIYGSYTFSTSFETGSTCEYTMDPKFTQDLALKVDNIIKKISLSSAENDSVYAFDENRYVEVEMDIPVGSIERYEMTDGSILKTRIMYQAFIYEIIDDSETQLLISTPEKYLVTRTRNNSNALKIGGDRRKIKIYFTDNVGIALLNPNKRYSIKINATLMYAFDNDSYAVLTDNNDKDVMDSKHIRIVTTKADPNKITTILSANPSVNERFFYIGDNVQENAYFIEYGNDNLMDGYSNRYQLGVEYEDVVTGEIYSSLVTKVNGQNKLVYSKPMKGMITEEHRIEFPLAQGRIYKVVFYIRAQTDTDRGDYKEIFNYYCRTSEYSTFTHKIDDISVSY
ncbi:MAG: hypothetical protein DRI84_09550, partial [Bacteroidetes bacterium]